MNLESGAPDNLTPEPAASPDSATESYPGALDRVRQMLVAAAASGLRESCIPPGERDLKFDECDFPAYRLREEVLANGWAVLEGSPGSGAPAPELLRTETKNGVRLEMRTTDSECDASGDGASRKVRQQILTRVRDGQAMTTEAIVSIVDEAGKAHELNRLLPVGVALVPGDVGPDGQTSSDDEKFSFSSPVSGSQVRYGDLTTNGGFLSFLHEAAHAWQSRLHPAALENYRYSNRVVGLTFRVYYFSHLLDLAEKSGGALLPQEVMDEAWRRGKTAPEMVDYMRRYVERNAPVVAGLGVTVTPTKITVENDSFRDSVRDYVWAERQAWSSAIRGYRTLEAEGLVPQPGEKEDVLGQAHSALRSYQAGLDFVEIETERPFTRKA